MIIVTIIVITIIIIIIVVIIIITIISIVVVVIKFWFSYPRSRFVMASWLVTQGRHERLISSDDFFCGVATEIVLAMVKWYRFPPAKKKIGKPDGETGSSSSFSRWFGVSGSGLEDEG